MWTDRQIAELLRQNGRHGEFPTGARPDEFTIVREDGRTQGIFKVWAPPVLPMLAGLERDTWCETVRESPAFLERELRMVLRNSWLIDQDLTRRFASTPLPESLAERVWELTHRLQLAFALMGPFYHLEALVDDIAWLGLDPSKTAKASGGLDVAAFLLPSAFAPFVIAQSTNWNGLSWDRLRELTAQALASAEHGGALLGLSGMLGVEPRHILFAANALEWIPVRVGGKKGDFSQSRALAGLHQIIETSRQKREPSCLSVLGEVNAQIRFFNWLPLIEGPENFRGRNWTYAAVCDTASELFATLNAHPELWQAGFAQVYEGQLRPQLLNLDATSARGRFLLDLIVNEERLACSPIENQWTEYSYRPSDTLIEDATHRFLLPSLVGTKPVGLTLAANVLGPVHVLPGLFFSTECVERQDWEVCAQAARAAWPDIDSWVVRSSSMDEGTARGVYESILQVPSESLEAAIVECVASYESPAAVAFRASKGITAHIDRREIAVLLQPYQAGSCGGVATVTQGPNGVGKGFHISVAETADLVTSRIDAQEHIFTDSSEVPEGLRPLIGPLVRLHDVFGGTIQVEWTLTCDDRLIVLQMEFISDEEQSDDLTENNSEIVEVVISSVKDIEAAITLTQDERPDCRLQIVVGEEINSATFQGELFTMVIRLGRRIRTIVLGRPVSPSSHFANICRHFGIKFE